MGALRLGAQFPGGDVAHLVADGHADAVVLLDPGVDAHGVAEADHAFVPAVHFQNGAAHAGFLHGPVTAAHLIHQVHPGLLHPADVIGMVHAAHLVRLVVFRVVFIVL